MAPLLIAAGAAPAAVTITIMSRTKYALPIIREIETF